MRVLWQSFLDPADHGPYLDALTALLEAAEPDVTFDVVGMRPPDRHLHALTEVRCGIVALRNALWAEHAGYDALVIGHFQEPFLHEIRATVQLPVVGLGEAGCSAAEGRIGLLTIDAVFVPWHAEQVRRLGIESRVVGIRALGVTPDAFMDAMVPGVPRDELLTRLEGEAAPLITAGADTLIPAGALPCVAFPDIMVGGRPFLNIVEIAAHAARSRVPNVGVPPPPNALSEFLDATGGPLSEPVR